MNSGESITTMKRTRIISLLSAVGLTFSLVGSAVAAPDEQWIKTGPPNNEASWGILMAEDTGTQAPVAELISVKAENYVGEGTFKFSPQLAMGELEWTYFRDNDCNLYGDFGQHIYQISRAIQPIRPQNVLPVLYKRCPFDGIPLLCSTSATGL